MDRNNLREWRLRKGVTLKQLAQRTGYKYSYLVRLEKGLSKGTPNTWIRLARELQIPMDDLFCETSGIYEIRLENKKRLG
ncbi:helix-turn-helix domain-containing protein [Desulfitobacterium sp. Sab5]|uniref:helix-turn-helix domain-containing protein n=1 Tax=Desulfitobacterium nosdiversum TaxID=3375356 RepID=UPI003CF70E16